MFSFVMVLIWQSRLYHTLDPQRGGGVDNIAGVKRQEAPETLVITQVSQQCAALCPLKETDTAWKSK